MKEPKLREEWRKRFEECEFLRKQVQERAAEIERLKAGQVSGFYCEHVPQFIQGAPNHEVLELVTAAECTSYVQKIVELTRQRDEAMQDAERYRAIKVWGGAIRDGEVAVNIRLYGLQGKAEEAMLSIETDNLDEAIDAAIKGGKS
jgi:hypothetical protein